MLDQLGVAFTVRPAGVEELEQGDPPAVARENARRKAAAVAREAPGELVLGVDTVVALDGRVYGKPADAAEAEAGLRALSGRTHEVISGLAVARGDRVDVRAAVTRVSFRTLSGDVLRWYVATGEWRDRAGGYAIQARGAALVARIDGDYLNVVGLPVAALLDAVPDLLEGAR